MVHIPSMVENVNDGKNDQLVKCVEKKSIVALPALLLTRDWKIL